MRIFPRNPGAGLSAFNPPPMPPSQPGLNPPPTPKSRSGQNPPPRPQDFNGLNPPPRPQHLAQQAGDARWEGVDPDWSYSDLQTLTARALWRSRSKVASDAAWRQLDLLPSRLAVEPLWRWGGEHRVPTVGADLSWRWQVLGDQLSLIEQSAAGLTLRPLLQLGKLPAADYSEQVDKLLRAAIEREERLPEILVQIEDLWSFFDSLIGLDLQRAPRTDELIQIAWNWAKGPVMALKHGMGGRGDAGDASLRPYQRNALVAPVVATPSHSSYPSGHATMAMFTSELLIRLLCKPGDARVQHLDRLARRIAFNRTVAGVHFPVDNAAGAALGRCLAGMFIGWASGKMALTPGFRFDPVQLTNRELKESDARAAPPRKALGVKVSPLLRLQWDAALLELQSLGF